MDRRRFIRALSGGGALALVPWTGPLVSSGPLAALGDEGGAPRLAFEGHPEPRPDVDGSRVLGAAEVRPELVELFDGLRAIPHIADGIGCHCGCGAMPDMRSLLSCYEGTGMARFCVICEGEGRLAVELHAEGRSLDEIRAAIDRRFGA